ncbi:MULTISPECIES: peptidoglycan-binding protein LysM [Burkholderia]|uniref:Peptidoglycan-binding protein LysM n=1 Tax=Burkholderia gladioli TaxID=28095 RepID=A0A2A7SF45_BURGA|nr:MULTISPECIES: peptidoglycan-binding protein LysM [Burkholderia]ATF87448.1 peptidoglycan-binding protein LysM [Burkholderia gladioli pv. gladioli]MBJ9660018.1 peptidoglycan-binding protein LysM [Burkholderia gladioli]MBJ9711500.1 peptidoglycan-binding protein LysM [Burkholderia gladioli]MBU9157712.1 peptidoglycan-binding protein LysM [Burkholderia gladioli]MBU9169779.1 peptidoglycan-binding protein LysM [Burkholderia gladioli]
MLEMAKIVVQKTGEEIPVMYNPTELSLNKTVQLQGQGSNVQFQRVDDDDLTVSLFFDTYEKQTDVRSLTNRIAALTQPTIGTAQRREPPVVVFTWAGPLFVGMISKLDQKFTMFLSSGVPVRAELSVTLKSVLTPDEDLRAQGYFNCRRLWQVSENDRLYLIAQRTLGDPGQWRLIAETNGIDDPLNFPTRQDIGRTLVIIDVHGESFNGAAHV